MSTKAQVVFANEKLPNKNALWFLKNCSEKEVPYNVESRFKLMHKETNMELYASRDDKSPTTGQREGTYPVVKVVLLNVNS
ncbi:16789_t:CDS:2 [Funneliformis mosseae]|uniref:16789_t:CDS:1 n=1 Tax=Funneliformis mosseae TaxID=27381 RepID=A0A9N9A4Y7_FUNMO|nr:16789_t:CDS:2 [Funneliformis mosseae]